MSGWFFLRGLCAVTAIHTIFASFICLLLCIAGSVGLDVSIPVCCLASFSSDGPVFSRPPGCLAGWFLKWVMLFHHCQQGFLFSSKGIHLLPHIFTRFVFGVRNAEEFSDAFHVYI